MIFPDNIQRYNFPSMFQIRIQEDKNYRTKKKKKTIYY